MEIGRVVLHTSREYVNIRLIWYVNLYHYLSTYLSWHGRIDKAIGAKNSWSIMLMGGRILPEDREPFHLVQRESPIIASEAIVQSVPACPLALIWGSCLWSQVLFRPQFCCKKPRKCRQTWQVIKIGPCHRVDGNLNLSRVTAAQCGTFLPTAWLGHIQPVRKG